MSVPLSRLYNFLHDVCNRDDIIIYRFFPHGSRKTEDLSEITYRNLSWFDKMTLKSMICHDQEPLNYDLYTKQDFYPSWVNGVVGDLIASMHLRALVTIPFNGNDQVLLCHSEKNSVELDKYTQHDFIGVYYWSHAIIARDWFRYARLDPALTTDINRIEHDFLIYNRAWSGTREYRLTFIEMLLDQGLHKFCQTTFNPEDSDIHYTDHCFKNQSLAISRTDIEDHFKPNSVSANASADYNAVDYNHSAIEIVLETLFDDSRLHLTEKALRPIACGHPFILAAAPGSLQYLRDYGFETFNGLIDESYDTIADPKERLVAIIKEMQRISALPVDEKHYLWTKLFDIAARNKKLFFSNEWHDAIVREFKENFDQAVNSIKVTGKYRTKLEELIANDPIQQKKLSSDIPGVRTQADLKKFREWLDKQSLNSN